MSALRTEWNRALRAFQQIDKQTACVLLYAALAVILQMQFGSRSFYRREVAELLVGEYNLLHGWIWWFSFQGVLGFVIPVAILRFGFGNTVNEMGLGLGDMRLAVKLMALYLPLVVIGTWILTDTASFDGKYPHYKPAREDWSVFLIYHAFFLLYWIGWEYLWRGFVLFGTMRTFGLMAIVVQAMPFAIMHFDKPLPEALLSIVGGVAIGAVVWRTRSFWIAVPIHAAQMLILDLISSLRFRAEAEGIGWDALRQIGAYLFG